MKKFIYNCYYSAIVLAVCKAHIRHILYISHRNILLNNAVCISYTMNYKIANYNL